MGDTRQPCSRGSRFVFGFLVLLNVFCNTDGRGNRIPVDSSGTVAQVCKSRECIDAAYEILGIVDTSIDPCDNFYDFACGGWIKSHPVPENQSEWDNFGAASKIVSERLKEILEREDKADDTKSIKDARKFYRACLAVDEQAERNMAILLDRLAIWGGWPMATAEWKEDKFDWKKLLVNLMRTTGKAPLLSIYVVPDRLNTSRNVISIDQPDTDCEEFSMGEKIQEAVSTYVRKHIEIIAEASNQSVSDEHLAEESEEVVTLKKLICEARSNTSDRVDTFKLYNVRTIAELQNMTDSAKPLKEASKIDWVVLLNDLLEGTDSKVNESQTVIVQELEYVVKLVRIVDATPRRALANFLLWTKITHMNEDISPEFRKLTYDLIESVLGASLAKPRWETCVSDTNTDFPHALGYEYVKEYFDADAKQNAKELVSNIVEAYIADLKETEWMDAETRALAVDKAVNLVVNVGYPDAYENRSLLEDLYFEYNISDSHLINTENIMKTAYRLAASELYEENDRERWITEIATVNAFYSVDLNSITIPAGIFQPPFYVKGRPEVLNYAAIGAVIGHEISHAFDAMGRTADKDGNLVQWWSADTLNTYQVKKSCIEEQYSKFPVPELLEVPEGFPDHMNGERTLNENIADNGGLQEAFAAYRRAVDQHGVEPRLPGLAHYSPQQLFYIGYASELADPKIGHAARLSQADFVLQVWCQSSKEMSVALEVLLGDHSPSKYRVLVPLGNSKDFADTWKCSQNDSKMNPAHKCEFW